MSNQLRKYDLRRSFLPSFFNVSDDFFTNFFESNNLPATNITENGKEFKIELSVPGFNKEDFKIGIEKNILTISAKKEEKCEEKDENEKIIRQEFNSSSFSRSFSLPESIDIENISAEQKDGILTVQLPKMDKKPEDKVKKIKIK